MTAALFDLGGRRALLTGAAGGIGSALALGLARAGADLALAERPGVEPSSELAAALAETGRDVRWYHQDLAEAATLAGFVDSIWADGAIDILVNNAGYATMDHFNRIDYAAWRATMSVDLDAPFLLSQRVAERMIHERVRGRIIMISSKNGLQAEPGLAHYNAAKGGLELLARSLAVELGPHGITVNTVCPGMVDTGLAGDFPLDWDAFVAYYEQHIPLEGRFADPAEMVGPVVFLASDAGSYVTGHSLVVDGGVLANQVPRLQFMQPYEDRIAETGAPDLQTQTRTTIDEESSPMKSQQFLESLGLPGGDDYTLPTSALRFADGGAFHIEIPSVEGPMAMEAVIDEAAQRNLTVHRVSQGSGIWMLTDDEIRRMVELGGTHGIEVCLFVGPRAGWDTGAQATSPGGAVVSGSLRGADQLAYGVQEVVRGCELGLRSVLVSDLGQLAVLGKLKSRGDLPADLVLKVSASLPVSNPAGAQLLEELGASSLNVAVDLSLPTLSAIRAAVTIPLDLYIESSDDFGGVMRYYEIPEIVRVAAPVHLKFAVRNSPSLYPSGGHLAGVLEATARERVRRAALGLGMLERADAELALRAN